MELDQNENVVKTAEQDLTTLEQSTQQTHVSRDLLMMAMAHGPTTFILLNRFFLLVLCSKFVSLNVVLLSENASEDDMT
jgi:hypothetical protein